MIVEKFFLSTACSRFLCTRNEKYDKRTNILLEEENVEVRESAVVHELEAELDCVRTDVCGVKALADNLAGGAVAVKGVGAQLGLTKKRIYYYYLYILNCQTAIVNMTHISKDYKCIRIKTVFQISWKRVLFAENKCTRTTSSFPVLAK